MTIDEAIKDLEYGTEQLEMEIKSGLWIKGSESEIHCKEGIALNKQHIEWLMELKKLRELNDKIYDVLAKQFGSPCIVNYTVDEYMRKNGGCYDCGVEIPDKECWSRYIQTKLIGDESNGI